LERLDRNIRFFGREGQARIQRTSVTVIGAGGLGSHVVQQLAYLGVGAIAVVDHETLEETNKNRYVTAHNRDAKGSSKVEIAARLIHTIDPTIRIAQISQPLRTVDAFAAVKAADFVFGCVDNDGTRLVLNELCAAYRIPYIDLATEIINGAEVLYGGRVCFSGDGKGCGVCLDLLNLTEAGTELANPEAQRDREQLYGVPENELETAGPSVVSINGVIASLGITEFCVHVSGLRAAYKLLTYRGDLGRVTRSTDESFKSCYYCAEVWGIQDQANVERFIPTA
jgi:hypothetical protein